MSTQRTYTIPDILPILPLPPGQVLFPSLVLAVQLASKHSIALLQAVLRDAEQQKGVKNIIIGTAPLKPIPSSSSKEGNPLLITPPSSDNDDDDDDDATRKPIQLIQPKRTTTNKHDKPPVEDLFEFGTAARIVRLERLPNGNFAVLLEGLSRIALSPSDYAATSSLLPYHETRITLLPTSPLPVDSPLLEALQSIAHALLATLGATSPLSALLNRRLNSLIVNLSHSTAPSLVDALVGSIPISPITGVTMQDKLDILAAVEGEERVAKGVELFQRLEVGMGLKRIKGEEVGRRQREGVLRRQMGVIRRELEELGKGKEGAGAGGEGEGEGEEEEEGDGDDLVQLEKAVKAKKWSEESRKVALRELKRLKKSPPQGAEHGVIRNYLDWLLSIPWTESTPLPLSRDFLTAARTKLDEDHYGLEKVKKRLMEWLAVLRLKQEQWESEVAAVPTPTAGTGVGASTELVLHESTAVPAPSPSPSPSPTPKLTSPPRDKGPILLLSGPPGTGKTSIARSLATAMNRKFYRISLGGVHDESEIRGHRRTFVSALPGMLVQALKATGVNNPVILLDEIDKLGMGGSGRGDPGAALLEVLDPEQNRWFKDHYIDVPLDLSSVLFIATANSLDSIPDPLYDRMEPIELSGYVHSEKLHIARRYLLPKQLIANALSPNAVEMDDETMLFLIEGYTHEAGVRGLERELGAVCRAKAVEFAQARDRALEVGEGVGGDRRRNVGEEEVCEAGYGKRVGVEDVERILGVPRFEGEGLDRENAVGVSIGLAYQGSGNGGILHIESTTMPGHGALHLTGSLGDVISESAHLAFAWIKSHAFELGIAQTKEEDAFANVDVHLHMPGGAVRKDGPSAGVALVVCIVSLMRGIPQLQGVAMTGEITLRGLVTPVGGIKEKVLGAHRTGIRTLLLPLKNAKDVNADLPPSIAKEVKFVYVKTIWEALEGAFGARLWEGRGEGLEQGVESRL